MPKDKIALQGEDSFKAEMFKEFSDTIEDNALYVATTGSDSNAGTIDKPFATVQKALDTVKAGQTIYVRGGTYNGPSSSQDRSHRSPQPSDFLPGIPATSYPRP